MLQKNVVLALAAYMALLVPPVAFAATGTVSATVTSAGQPVAGATVTLVPADPSLPTVTGETDENGQVTITEVEEGAWIAIVSGRDIVKTEAPLTVQPGQDNQAPLSAPPLQPTMAQGPPRALWPSFGILVGRSSTDDHTPTLLRDVLVGKRNGQEFLRQESMLDPAAEDTGVGNPGPSTR